MSGFAAAYLSAAPIAICHERLTVLAARLRHRGRAGQRMQILEPVAFVQFHDRLGSPGPDGAGAAEAGPWRLRPDGPILCGDLAIVEGPELARAAGSRYRGDALAILAAYDRWGLEAGARIEGEFAFVIWDPERRRLVAWRDRFGVRPLAYRATGAELWLASEPAALAGDAPLDARWITEFLSGEDHDAALSAFSGVHRLLPGHRLLAEGGQLRVEPWYRLEPRALSEAEAPEALAEALGRAVGARMGDDFVALLSGGLDSSTLTCLAARRAGAPVRALSLRYPQMPELDEGAYIEAVRRCGNINGIDATIQPGTSFDGLERMFSEQGYPIFAPNHGMLRQGYCAAAASGARVLLDGHGGDEVIGTGNWYFSELAHEKRWLRLWHGLRAEHAASGDSPPVRRLLAALRVHGPRGLRRALRGSAARATGAGLPDLSLRAPAEDALDPVSRAAFRHDHLAPFTRFHAQILLNAGTPQAFEMLDRLGARLGIAPRFPFYDRRVVEIALGQPTRAKFAPGQPRLLLRRAMVGILPEEVRTRPGKTDFMPSVIAGFQAPQLQRLRALAQTLPEPLRAHVDPAGLRGLLARFEQASGRAEAVGPLMRVLWLDLWLSLRSGAAPALERACP